MKRWLCACLGPQPSGTCTHCSPGEMQTTCACVQNTATNTCAHLHVRIYLLTHLSLSLTHNLFLVFPISGIYFWSGLPHKWNLLLKTSRETTSRKDSSLISSLCWYDVSMSTLYYLQFLSYPFCNVTRTIHSTLCNLT